MAKRLRVGIIFGGRSGEHEVSLRSAGAVIEAFDRAKYDLVPIGITPAGKWLAPAASAQLLSASAQLLLPAATSPPASGVQGSKSSNQDLVALDAAGGALSAGELDVVFPVLHGPYGEDGTIQGLLEMANVPYVGCGVLASSCGMDKVTMKSLFAQAGLPICKYLWFLRSHWKRDRAGLLRKVKREIGFPCFIKPANLGSSVGVSKAVDEQSLIKAIALAAKYDRKIIVEEGLDAREIECAVLGNDEPRASLPGEYVIHQESARFLDYTEKYASTGHVDFVVPAALPKDVTAKIQRIAIRAFQAIDGAGLARVDFFLRRDTKELMVNELNSMPGLTEVSGYPKMWEASGLSFPRVLARLLELAFQRHRDKSLNKISR